MAGGGGAATARTPAPRSVRMDRLVLGSLAVAVLGGFAFQAMLKERETRDWSVVHQDSIALQGLEGIVMGFRGSEEMDSFLTEARDRGWSKGRRYLVTGGNRGLGRGIAARLLALGAGDVIVTARSAVPGLAAALASEALALPWPDSKSSSKPQQDAADSDAVAALAARVTIVPLDLADLASVDAAAAAIAARFSHVDVAILNAGLVPKAETTLTQQGFELGLGVNAIGHYRLVQQLRAAEVLGSSPGDRLIVVTSETFRSVPPLDLETVFDPVNMTLFNTMHYYARSKVALNTLGNTLARRTAKSGLRVHHICPGPVATDIGRDAPAWTQPIAGLIMKLFQGPDQASWPVLMLAVDPRFGETTGSYYHMYRPKAQRADVVDVAKGDTFARLVDEAIAARVPRATAAGKHEDDA